MKIWNTSLVVLHHAVLSNFIPPASSKEENYELVGYHKSTKSVKNYSLDIQPTPCFRATVATRKSSDAGANPVVPHWQ